MPLPTLPPPTPTTTPTFSVQKGTFPPPDRSLIAYEAVSDQNRTLLLADPSERTVYEFSFPAAVRFATPFLAGLSPDARYFAYFEGGKLETIYGEEQLLSSTPDLVLHVLDLSSGDVIFSAPLLSPSFPQDLAPIVEIIKDDWVFSIDEATFADKLAATQKFMLNNIRNIAWSPDGSLLAFASQDPGPSSDLYFFSPQSNAARRVTKDPEHMVEVNWSPDSAALVMDASYFSRHAREDTNYLLTREGSLLGSFTSQIWFFHDWQDATHAYIYGRTDAGENFDLKRFSTADGTLSMFLECSFTDIAFTPDLATFLLSSTMPSEPVPGRAGLYLGRREGVSLITLSEGRDWGGVSYWGSERFTFAASSFTEGTVGITRDGERVNIDDKYWNQAVSPGGKYLAGYNRYYPGYGKDIVSGLRVFDGSGNLLKSEDNVNVNCVRWNAASTALAYQVESRLYLWDAVDGSTRLISDRLDPEGCTFIWVREKPSG